MIVIQSQKTLFVHFLSVEVLDIHLGYSKNVPE